MHLTALFRLVSEEFFDGLFGFIILVTEYLTISLTCSQILFVIDLSYRLQKCYDFNADYKWWSANQHFTSYDTIFY